MFDDHIDAGAFRERDSGGKLYSQLSGLREYASFEDDERFCGSSNEDHVLR